MRRRYAFHTADVMGCVLAAAIRRDRGPGGSFVIGGEAMRVQTLEFVVMLLLVFVARVLDDPDDPDDPPA